MIKSEPIHSSLLVYPLHPPTHPPHPPPWHITPLYTTTRLPPLVPYRHGKLSDEVVQAGTQWLTRNTRGRRFSLTARIPGQNRPRRRIAGSRGVTEVTALGVNASGGQPGAGKDNNGVNVLWLSSGMAVLGL